MIGFLSPLSSAQSDHSLEPVLFLNTSSKPSVPLMYENMFGSSIVVCIRGLINLYRAEAAYARSVLTVFAVNNNFPHHGAMQGSVFIRHGRTFRNQRRLCNKDSLDWITLRHVKVTQETRQVLAKMHGNLTLTLSNLHTEKPRNQTKILHFEVKGQYFFDKIN